MNNIKVKSFAEKTPEELVEKIEKFAKHSKFKIKQISAYCNTDKMFSERAIVIFEES